MKKIFIKNGKLKGFTLIEIILYVALISIFITGVVIFAWDVINARQKSRAEQEVIYAARLASRRINFEIRNASAVNSVTTTSISLANSNASLSPTVIDFTAGRLRIGYGSTGSCPVGSPCFLTPAGLTVQSMRFFDRGDVGNLADVIEYEMAIKNEVTSGRLDWFYAYYASGSAEVRSK